MRAADFDPRRQNSTSVDAQPDLSPLLRPPLLSPEQRTAELRFANPSPGTFLDRPVIRAHARPRGSRSDQNTNTLEFWFDAVTGIVLRRQQLVNGQLVRLTEATRIRQRDPRCRVRLQRASGSGETPEDGALRECLRTAGYQDPLDTDLLMDCGTNRSSLCASGDNQDGPTWLEPGACYSGYTS